MKLVQLLLLPAVLLTGANLLCAQDFNIQFRGTLDYPGQTLANICGYAKNGKEYALVGASKGLSIVDVTNPANPVQIVQIPGPDNLWKEIKVYQHYAYVTSEGGGGVQIVDLGKLPNPNLDYHNYTGTGEIAGQLNEIHALHIDETTGFLYTYGGNFSSARVHDLNADPYNPEYVGKFDQLGYIHDGYVDNDTLYACHINAGIMSIVDMRDKANPILLGSMETPSRFAHNSWLLSNRTTVLTTDERVPSFLTAYDVSDPGDIRELDRFSTNDGYGSIGHNTHILNDWAITSWYTDGLNIVDAHRPENLVMVGQYDTWPAAGANFDGCWGVYPYLPSGNLIATNIPNTNGGTGRLFVLTPTYQRACYLEGRILDGCTGQPLAGVEIKFNGSGSTPVKVSRNNGIYKSGQAQSGPTTVIVSKDGYITQFVNVTLVPEQVVELNITLEPTTAFDVSGQAVDQISGAVLANKNLTLTSPTQTYQVQTDNNGTFAIPCMGGGNYRVGAWGYRVTDATIANDGLVTIPFEAAYYDDFELDLGWSKTATAASGFWQLGKPVRTTFQNNISNPESDVDFDNNEQCYVTGNTGGQAGADDVDDGAVTLSTPPMQLAAYADAKLTFRYWFFNAGGTGNPNDKFEVLVTNGQQTVTVFTQSDSESSWRASGDIHLKDYLPLTDNLRVLFVAFDANPGHIVEAAVDAFEVVPGVVSAPEPDASAALVLTPNPSSDVFQLRYEWPTVQNATLEVRNLLGQTMLVQPLGANSGTVRFGQELSAGVYLVQLRSEGRMSSVAKVVKTKG
jgi:choice-of-anchor B domain-containing protein